MIAARDKDIKSKLIDLEILLDQKKQISKSIAELVSIYKIDPSAISPKIWFNLISEQKMHPDDAIIDLLSLREKFRDDHTIKVDELNSINQKIKESNIDILLDKIEIFKKTLKED